MNDDDNDPFVFEEIFGETKEDKLQTIWRYLEELRKREKRQAGLRQESIPTASPNDLKIDEVVALMKEIGGGGHLQLYYSLKWDWAFGRDELGAPSGFIATLGAGHQAKRFAT
jgi:hypothetical protein